MRKLRLDETIVIDHPKYGKRTEFDSIEKALETIRALGDDFEDTSLWVTINGNDVMDQDEVVGKVLGREDRLRALAQAAAFMHYDSAKAKQIMDKEDWQDWWPVVDSDGELTGEIVGSEEGYWNVDDMAMIAENDYTGMVAEGYATEVPGPNGDDNDK